MVQFNFPRADWNYRIDPAGLQSFATLDAADFGGRSDEASLSVAQLITNSAAVPGGIVVYSASEQTVDENRASRPDQVGQAYNSSDRLKMNSLEVFQEVDFGESIRSHYREHSTAD